MLTLESQRNRCAVVGENLGTVPPEVQTALRRRGLLGMFVVQYELRPNLVSPLPEPPGSSVASLNTHDMPTFASFWEGRDIRQRRESGLLDVHGAREESRRRVRMRAALARWLRLKEASPRLSGQWLRLKGRAGRAAILRACLRWLSASRSRMIQISLEDLWGETEPQNVPGTSTERPNWRRKWRYRLEPLKANRGIQKILRQAASLRKRGSSQSD